MLGDKNIKVDSCLRIAAEMVFGDENRHNDLPKDLVDFLLSIHNLALKSKSYDTSGFIENRGLISRQVTALAVIMFNKVLKIENIP